MTARDDIKPTCLACRLEQVTTGRPTCYICAESLLMPALEPPPIEFTPERLQMLRDAGVLA